MIQNDFQKPLFGFKKVANLHLGRSLKLLAACSEECAPGIQKPNSLNVNEPPLASGLLAFRWIVESAF